MKIGQLSMVAIAALASLSATARGEESLLEHIDRKIVEEPAYDWFPVYLLVAFGPEAKSRVWFVEDDHKLYIDRNSNNDLTDDGPPIVAKDVQEWQQSMVRGLGAKEFQYESTELSHPGEPTQKDVSLIRWNYGFSNDTYRLSVLLDGTTPMYAFVSDSDWATSPSEARILHFGGALTPMLMRTSQFVLNSGMQRLSVGFFNRGLGHGAATQLGNDAIPAGAVPTLEIRWPTIGTGLRLHDPPAWTTLLRLGVLHDGLSGAGEGHHGNGNGKDCVSEGRLSASTCDR